MERRLIAAVILTALILGMVSPVLVQETDALDLDDYYITIPGTQAPSKHIEVTMGNGESRTWKLCVINASEKYLDISFDSSTDNKEVKVTDIPEATLIGPEGSSEPSVAKGDLTIKVDQNSDAYDSVSVDITVYVVDAADPEQISETHVYFDIKVTSIYDASGMYNKFFGLIPNTLPAPFNSPIVPAIVSILVYGFIAWVVGSLILKRIAKVIGRNTSENEAKNFERATKWPIVILTMVLTLNTGLLIMDAGSTLISQASFVTYIMSVILVSIILWKIYMQIVKSVFRKIERVHADSTIDTSLIPLFRMIGMIFFWVAGTSAVLAGFGVDLQGILVSAGVISLGITLGAQNVLSQFFSGILILVNRPFKTGDFLKINDKVYVVRKVRLMYTEFKNWGGDEIITMPNNVVTSATISNMTKGDVICRQYVYFSVAYGTDLKKAQEVMIEAAKKCDLVVQDANHDIETRITDFLSSGIELRLSVYTPTFDDTGEAAGKLRGLIYEAFAENDIEIPYDRVQIDILSDHTEKVSNS